MILAGRPAKILLIDTNVYFSKRVSDALKKEGFEVICSTQPSFALTTIEYDPPTAIVCSTNMREMGALDIARLIRADAKNAALPIIALGDGSQRALMEAFQAGCDDYIDRTRPPANIATHVRNIIISKAEGFQPTQMLTQADTSMTGSLSHTDLPGVLQMLTHAHRTGALHLHPTQPTLSCHAHAESEQRRAHHPERAVGCHQVGGDAHSIGFMAAIEEHPEQHVEH